jgi:hypothetical protein
MEQIYFVWLFLTILVLPALIPLVLPFVLARGLYQLVPKWPFLLRWSISLLLVTEAMNICFRTLEWMLKRFAG